MEHTPYEFRLIGGRLAADCANTANWRADGAVATERLIDDAAASRWLRAVGLPEGTSAVQLLALRAVVRPTLLAAITGDAPPPMAMKEIERAVRAGPGPLADDPIARIACSALACLEAPDRGRLKRCPGDDCGWVFIDESRGARRRWCSMELCGNRAKTRAHYARSKSG